MTRVYGKEFCISKDERILKSVKNMRVLLDKGSVDELRKLSKSTTNYARSLLETDRVVGLVVNGEYTKVRIILYDIKASDDDFYEQCADDENRLYIDVPLRDCKELTITKIKPYYEDDGLEYCGMCGTMFPNTTIVKCKECGAEIDWSGE